MSGYTIFLIGLQSGDQAFAKTHFSGAGHVVQVGESTRLAELLDKAKPTAIYLHSRKSENAVKELKKANSTSPHTPVVLVYHDLSGTVVLDAWHAGAADVIGLPLTAQSLDRSLQRALTHVSAPQTEGEEEGEARLRFLDDTGQEQWCVIASPKFTIGRGNTNDLSLTQMSVSRQHAEIVKDDSQYWLHDLGSRHGTYLNGTRIEKDKLTNGDRIQLGGPQAPVLTFRQGDLLQSLLDMSDSHTDIGLHMRGFRDIGLLLGTFRALSSIPLLDDLLSLVVDTAIELTGAERGFIMLKEDDGSLSFRCARDSAKRSLDQSSFRTSKRGPEDVLATGRRVAINDLDAGDAGDHTETRRWGVRRIFCVPLRHVSRHDTLNLPSTAQAQIIGVLSVDSQSVGVGLSDTHLDALETLASEAAIAIYNARLFNEAEEKRRMDEELAIAKRVQQALLPPTDKIVPFACAHSLNLPCREVGGDYYDYFELEGDRFGFALADVAGKGMPAALLMSMVDGIFSAQTLADFPLPSMMSNVNRKLVQRGSGDRFVTFFFGILDSQGNFTYTNAGHDPPLLLRPDGSISQLKEGGMVLGLFASAQYESKTITISPGDHIVLFTDGLVEARNTAEEEFGNERLQNLLREVAHLPSVEIRAVLEKAVSEYSSDAPQHDDITLMVVGFRE